MKQTEEPSIDSHERGENSRRSIMNETEFMTWLGANRASVRTPAYIYAETELENSLRLLKGLFPTDVRVFYALKSNPQPEVVRFLSQFGVGGEIASDGERRLCGVAGLKPDQILVGGVSKSADYLADVCEKGHAGIVVESPGEWLRLKSVLSEQRRARVLLRVNPGLSLGGLDMAGESQFGLDVEQALSIAAECRSHAHAEFAGLHFFFGSQRLTVDPIVAMVNACGDVLETFRTAGIPVGIVDLGLGCGVPYLEKDSSLDMAALAEKLQPIWQRPTWQGIQFWTEAGRALVARSGFYVTRVLDKKPRKELNFAFLDGGLHTHNPGVGLGRFFRSNPRFLFLCADQESRETVDLVGNLCTSADSLGRKVNAPKLAEGDLVVIPNAGAYCQTTAMWGFNGQPLFSEYMLSGTGKLRDIEPQYSVLLAQAPRAERE
jgi:diaminopimelate decarboxylase